MPGLLDSVLETSTSTGTGALALAGAVAGFVSVSSRLTDGQTAVFLIEAVDANLNPTGAWEICEAQYNSAGPSISNRIVIRSSNADALVNFATGTKTIAIVEDPRVLQLPYYNAAQLPAPSASSPNYNLAVVEDARWSGEGPTLAIRRGTNWLDLDGDTVQTTPKAPLRLKTPHGWRPSSLVFVEDALRHNGLATNFAAGILIPAYIYPSTPTTNAAFGSIIQAARTSRRPVVAILNPSNGPGASVNTDYQGIIRRLTSNGVTVAGYVPTQYGARSSAAVEADILQWASLYPQVKAIFFDEFPSTHSSALESYYVNLCQLARKNGFWFTIANPGTLLSETWFSNVEGPDLFVVYENAGYPSSTVKNDIQARLADGRYSKNRIATLVHTAAYDEAEVAWLTANSGFTFVTSDVLPNPWDTVGHIERLGRHFAATDRVPVFSSLPANPQPGDVCVVNRIEYICLTAGAWVLRSSPEAQRYPGTTRAERYKQWLQSITAFAPVVRYASPSGSTGNDGSRAAPWPLQFGIDQMTAGGVLIVLDGVYSTSAGDALLDCNNAGTASAPITIAAENLHGARLHSTSKLFGVRVNSAAVYNRIAGLEVSGVSNSGIITYANYTDVLYNYVHSMTPVEGVDGGAGINYIGTADQVGGLCEGNHIHDIGDFDSNTWGSGASPSTRVHGIYITRSNATFRNNLIYRIKAMGITTWRNPKFNVIAYNTVYLCKYGAISVGAGDHATPLAENNVVVGNIAAHSYLGLDESEGTGTNVFDRNLVWQNTADLSLLTSTATNTTTADPLLIFPACRGDFRPMFTSPVRRAGETTYLPPLDFDLLPRETADLGCFAVREEVEREDAFGGASAFVMPWSLPVPLPPDILTATQRPIVNAIAGATTATLALTDNRTYWIPFSVRRTIRVIALTTEVNTALAGTHTLYVYAANRLGQPTKRLASGTFDAGTTGTKTVTLNLPLEPGIYYIVWQAASAARVRAIAVGGAVTFTHAVGSTVFSNHFFTTGTPSDPAPASGYSVGTTALPAVGVEYVT